MLEIEQYTAPDLPVIESFIAALHDAERELIPILSPGAEFATAGVRQMLDDISDNKGLALLAKSEGFVVGFGCVLFDDYRDPSYCEAQRRRAYLSYLYVTGPWRRRGVARALLAYMEAGADVRDSSPVSRPSTPLQSAAMRQQASSRTNQSYRSQSAAATRPARIVRLRYFCAKCPSCIAPVPSAEASTATSCASGKIHTLKSTVGADFSRLFASFARQQTSDSIL